jgi:hypothetical protein
MKLRTHPKNEYIILVSTDWATYTVVFSNETAQIVTLGLEEEFDISYFPDSAKNEAIAVFLITQLELKSLE